MSNTSSHMWWCLVSPFVSHVTPAFVDDKKSRVSQASLGLYSLRGASIVQRRQKTIFKITSILVSWWEMLLWRGLLLWCLHARNNTGKSFWHSSYYLGHFQLWQIQPCKIQFSNLTLILLWIYLLVSEFFPRTVVNGDHEIHHSFQDGCKEMK